MSVCSVINCCLKSLKELTCSLQKDVMLFLILRVLQQLFFITCFILMQSSCKAHLSMCTYRNSFIGSSHFSPRFFVFFVRICRNPGELFFFYFNMSLSYHASLLYISSTLLNKAFPVSHRYLHCINPFCASGGCSGLPALGSVWQNFHFCGEECCYMEIGRYFSKMWYSCAKTSVCLNHFYK